jgi:CHAD domain-containing protein
MARSSKVSVQPLRTLGDLTTTLEASVVECLARTGKKTVHKLRTATRRIEAQLQLLAMLPDLPPHRKAAADAMKLLRDLRRSAGQVRDLDVQRDLLRQFAATKNHPAAAIRDEARKLNHAIAQKRDDKTAELLKLLRKYATKLPPALRRLREALAPAESLSLTESRLIDLVRNWYAQYAPAKPPDDPDRLHDIRKKAKLARYLAESAPKSAARAVRLAAKYENLQQAGGEWHDYLLLAEVAAGELGKSAVLVSRFNACADRSLRIFQRHLRYKI